MQQQAQSESYPATQRPGPSNDGWWDFDSTIASSCRQAMSSFQVSSSRDAPLYIPDFDVEAAMDAQYCFPPRTNSGLIPFSPSFSPVHLRPTLDGDANFPMSGALEASTPHGSAYWPDLRIYDNDQVLRSPQWSAISTNAWGMSAFDVPDALSPYPTYSPSEFTSPLPHILPRDSSPDDASSGRLSPLSSFASSASSSRRGSIDTSVKRCSHCDATTTPLWRRNPATRLPLCNACGLYLQQRNKMRPLALIEAEQAEDDPDAGSTDGPECSHCHTQRTSVWRRSKTGAKLCNACGVYARLRGRDRPLALRRNKIKPRCKHAK
ncbi:hypothetical protein B0H17DRAFT_1211475 [Mycena rosella]|uniref:GATA-type domain-containing protein n=1 Tax=Mycena rosella TaxID=1033263 RepID=A0AAD7G404_MYCRO|nr:hypothetical protein B0H17DRAFT_1211475 [Mycena rosella]